MIIPSGRDPHHLRRLDQPLTCLNGIGAKRAQFLSRKGLDSILDLLFFIPLRYEDRTRLVPVSEADLDETLWLKGEVILAREDRPVRKGKGLFRARIRDKTGSIELVWFHYRKPHLKSIVKKGTEIMAYGQIRENRGRRQMIHPHIVALDGAEEKDVLGYFPVYSTVEGVPGQVVRSAVLQAIEDYSDDIIDVVPRALVKRLHLPSLKEAIKGIHLPPENLPIDLLNRSRTEYHRRLLFDRFFFFMFHMALRKKERLTGGGPAFVIPPDLLDRFQGQIPFTLTGDQVGVIKDIMSDMTRDAPMNRLVQGDVGCGKTVVAAAAVAAAVLNRCQAALMAPTQILARQHYEFFSNLSTELGIRPVLLTGVLEKKERLDLYQKISEGECNLVIGTQALIQEGLSFHKLGLVVIDEQHRFGVRQRALLRSKGTTPHTLVMTATPIPRSLALILYGDTDISTIREYPGGRRAVHTYVVKDEKRQRGYEGLVKRLAQGEQGLVICPAIEATETRDMENAKDMFHKLKGIVPPKFRIALIHGRLAPAEKNDIMSRFRRGDMDLLVSTTVVEVGVHAPGATVLLIEHPERFGLSQLHQLRGRVGRGSQKGLCLLMLPEKVSEEAFERLKVMTETSDGFEIAQKDLEMRGQGELMGFRQAGAGEIDLMEIMEEPELLMEAKRAAEEIIENDPELNSYDQLLLIKNKE